MHVQVRFGQQKRYQDWFQRQYLSTAESQSLRCDLIRYICGVVHPSNEVLSSDILPRWAIIGWLLTTCTVGGLRRVTWPSSLTSDLPEPLPPVCLQSNVAASNAKLALFYDWLFFNPDKDSIMNIGLTHTQALHTEYTPVHTAGPDQCVFFRTSHTGDASLHEASSCYHSHPAGLHVQGITHTL